MKLNRYSKTLIAITGIGVVALPTGIISSGFIEALSEIKHEEKVFMLPGNGYDFTRVFCFE